MFSLIETAAEKHPVVGRGSVGPPPSMIVTQEPSGI